MRRKDFAPPSRTLIDIIKQSADVHPDQPAIDDGHVILTYTSLLGQVTDVADRLTKRGIGQGDRVGIRMPSGSADLYIAVLGTMAAGAAYVPVDADDPRERADLVFDTAKVLAVWRKGLELKPRGERTERAAHRPPPAPSRILPGPDDDAWIIFTSGSTGTPKGVAVTHRSAAAFVDAEARLFLQDAPLGPGDRVLAGLSVAFDASCEEMWLAWRSGACLVPAPRALVRSGMDLAPWLVDRHITVVSTVPTLASLWPSVALDAVRLLIFGGEACPPELVDRLAIGQREVWNTYGPTEATVVACGARVLAGQPVRIGLPLDGWELAVVDRDGVEVEPGDVGELIIGGVGLARYLDEALSAERFASMPSLGWDRAYRSGDLVRRDADGLLFVGRADDQVKVGGRRIELGEIDASLLRLPGVAGAATAVRVTATGNRILVGYLTLEAGASFDRAAAVHELRERMPAALVPLLAVVDDIPTRTSGKVDRDSLPWPLTTLTTLTALTTLTTLAAPTTLADGDSGNDGPDRAGPPARLDGTAEWVAGLWVRVLGVSATDRAADFFADGGGSLAAAQLVAAMRERFPQVAVADVYENPQLGTLADRLDELVPLEPAADAHEIAPMARRAQVTQQLISVVLSWVPALRWLTWAGIASDLVRAGLDVTWLPSVSWWVLALGWLLLVSPPGRIGLTVLAARLLLRGVRPGKYPRGGSVHLRLWAAEAAADAFGATNLSCAPYITYYAKALGAKVGRGVDLQAIPPVTGLLTLGNGASVEPEVDLRGYWLDGDVLRIGRVRVGARASVGTRSILLPGARVGQDAEVAAGSAISGSVPPGELWGGSPCTRLGVAHRDWPTRRPQRRLRWVPVYAASATVLAALPLAAMAAVLALLLPWLDRDGSLGAGWRLLVELAIPAAAMGLVIYALATLILVRLLGLGLREGHHPVRSRIGWQVWATERLMDDARTHLYPLYASLLTPVWMRALGADVGRDVEASTVLMLPKMTTVGDGAFLADDTLIGSYELSGGWLRIEPARIGKRSFLGNSGMTGPGRVVRKNSLVAVLSAAPEGAKAGTSWLGSPPVELRRSTMAGDESRTFAPSRWVRVQRGLVEVCRLLPVALSIALAFTYATVLLAMVQHHSLVLAAVLSGPLLVLSGVLAATVATVAKWLLVGRHRRIDHPLWSGFVWRNELADVFVEILAVPWFVDGHLATPAFNVWLRSLGARIGRGVWCQTYWLPEHDLVRLGDAVSVNRGCVLQTHLFHDRIMSMDTVVLDDGATLGPQSVILPAASVGVASTVGPLSLVLRGDAVPPGTRWTGNPIAPWT